ncbi:hypothetical protein AWZ03_005179 [Drosophila navojoa]|uniref:Uncharacterized protein n=1 Tax=Drosophila navojoa TaxID=7232 RepID=A0A484BIC4_DRONA|nr:uncharacterized protein LOC108654099 [Drosophila navojoa]TDG48434.1 hypothetical protein AWZ03_005179 [Drosophila navojoa]
MWSNFEASTVEDETISNAFSSRSIFKISSEDEVSKYPAIQAAVQSGKMVISIDKSLLLLEDELIAKCSFLSFGANIDAIAISNSGNLIVCGLTDGEVHGVYIKGLLLFSVCIKVEDTSLSSGTFTSIQQLGSHFYFTCKNGSVYCLSEINETHLESLANVTVNDNENMAALLDDVTIERTSSGRAANSVDSALLLKMPTTHGYAINNQEAPRADHDLIINGAQDSLNFKTVSNDVTRIGLSAHLGRIKSIYNMDIYVLALTESGHLLEICPFTRTLSLCQSAMKRSLLIEDLLVMESSEEHVELLILTKPTADGERFIKIVEYPSFKCKNEIEVPLHAWLIRQPKSAVNLYYLAARAGKENEIPSEVEMMMVSETDPSDRLKKLIAKGRLDEAEDFGIQFELCLQPIYEARAKRVLVELCNANTNRMQPEELEEKFQMLLNLLGQIESKEFIKNNRMINLSSRQILERYLKEIHKRLDFEDDEQHMLEIDEQLHRLKTLAIIDPYECNTEWQKFVYNTNLVKVIKGMFSTDMPTACLIWRRHSSSVLPHLSEDELRTLLGFIPSTTEPLNVVQWLRQFVPIVSNTHPKIMPFITDWSIEMTRKLQYSEHWPDIGLEFASNILEIFEEVKFIYSDVGRQQERNVGKLRDLVNALQDLSVLKKIYKLSFTLDNYMEDSLDGIALRILQRVHLDNLQSLVKDFLYPIYQEKGRQPLNAIKQYIGQLVANRQSLSNWIDRAMACVELLHNEDSRLESALSILQNAPVPWPESLAPLIKLRNSTHPLSIKINAEYEIQVIKIMKVKYGWPADSAVNINLELFMMRIVKLNLPDMLQDIHTLTKAAPVISTSANFNCCYQMARRGQIEMAYEFFKSLNTKSNDNKCGNVVEILTNMLEMSSGSFVNEAKVQEHINLLELFKLMLPHVDPVYTQRYLLIKHCFQLRQKFNLQLQSSSELIPMHKRLELLNKGIELIMSRAQATLNVCAFIVNEMSELCAALNLQKVQGLLCISQRMNCLPLSCALAHHILEFIDCVPANSNDFINFAIELLAQQICEAKSNGHDTHSSLQQLNETDPLCFPLAYELLTEAMLHEHRRQRDLNELIKYVRVAVIHYPMDAIETHYLGKEQKINDQICRALDGSPIALGDTTLNFSMALNNSIDVKPNVESTSKKRYSVSMFEEIDVQPQQQPQKKKRISGSLPIVKFLARTLLLMIIETDSNNSLMQQLQQLLPENVRNDIDGARADFFLSLEHLTKAKEHDVWYIMSQYLLDYQKQNHSKKIINEGFITLQLRRILRNAMNNKDANLIELFTMLTADTESRALLDKLSMDIKTDQQRIHFLTLSAMYHEHIDEMDYVQILRAKRNKLYYYLEFCQQDPSIKGKFNAEMDNIDQLLKEFHNKRLNVQLLERMSSDFGLDYQKMLITQILSILNAQELRYEIKTDTFGDEELVILSSVQEIRDMCQPYINEIKNVDLFIAKLKQFIEEINIYFYELYLCVIEILIFFDAAPKQMETWINILHFLRHKMNKRRRNRPGQLETDMWLQSQKENGVLPKIARYRLPFKPIVEKPLKDILDSELNVDNCQSWFPLILMCIALKNSKEISQNCDYFCMAAVKNSIAEYKSKNDSETWSLHPTNNAFLKSILRLVKNVHSPSKVFLILYFVAGYAPEGADQVEASYECWKYAMEHEELTKDPKCQEQLVKIKRRYPMQKTQHLLHVYGMTDEKLLRLVEHPTELIHCLYHHELILKSSKVDINGLVKEICALHELSLDAIQFKLLQKWLSVTMETTDGTIMEETFLEDHNWPENGTNGSGGDETGNASENVVRAFYILSSWPKSEAVQFLVGLIFKGGPVNTSTQLQMYECYSKLNDGSNSFSNTISQRQFITIKCVHELKALGYNSNIEKFADDSCDKISILKMLWQRNAQNSLSLEVMADICLGFDIHLPKIWNGILKRMVIFNMVRELNALVDVLSCKRQLLHLDGLALAWDCVLSHPLKNAVQTRSNALEERLQKTLLRLQGCPVVHALNLYQFAELCMLIQRPHMAAIVLIFCQSAEDREKVKKLITSKPMDNLRQQILDLEDAGLLPMVLNFALKELNL